MRVNGVVMRDVINFRDSESVLNACRDARHDGVSNWSRFQRNPNGFLKICIATRTAIAKVTRVTISIVKIRRKTRFYRECESTHTENRLNYKTRCAKSEHHLLASVY